MYKFKKNQLNCYELYPDIQGTFFMLCRYKFINVNKNKYSVDIN